MREFFLALIFVFAQVPAAETFRLSLLGEPHSLNPQTTAARGGNYLFHSIYRGLYRYHSQRGLILEGARSCTRSNLKLTCVLRAEHRWSTGQPIVAADYVRSFRSLIDPEHKSPQRDIILTLKNARAISTGKTAPSELGVTALNSSTIQFEFSEDDPEFEFKLINPALAPTPEAGFPEAPQSESLACSGPYRIVSWKRGRSILLTANPHYGLKSNPHRPDLEVFFIDDDSTGLRLYEAGKLNFLRRLTAEDIPRYRKSPDFVQIPMARFDYVGFGPELEELPKLRQALIEAVDFKGFMALFDTKGPPGCPSLPQRLLDRNRCIEPNVSHAKSLIKGTAVPPLKFYFSKMGGDDIERSAEWFQNQWKKNLNLHVELASEEQVVYLRRLRVKPPAIFRKGVTLDRPTCLAGLELFTKDNPENFVGLKDEKFESLVSALKKSRSENERRANCRKAVEQLMQSNRIIPLGEMYFTLLIRPKFKNWDLNELNQLDLTDLTEVKESGSTSDL